MMTAETRHEEELLTVPEAARLLGISDRTLLRWLVEKDIPHAKLGRLVRFRRSALLAWVAEQERITMERKK
jgi:excisionase family DNA binding protein